jgi:hypothetical protein
MKNMNQIFLLALVAVFAASCVSSTNKNSKNMKSDEKEVAAPGTYGYDLEFLKAHQVEFIELKDPESNAALVVIPQLQGRVMTSSANGAEGKSFGWINYKLFDSGKMSTQFNPFGGEERFWLGPEGGPFSVYFQKGKQQVFENWVVPPVLDTESYDVIAKNEQQVKFAKNTILKNASGTEFNIGIERTVSILSKESLKTLFNVDVPAGLDVVAYQSDNKITNNGGQAWIKENGLPSIWMLCMFNPSPTTTVFIPYKPDADGVIVNDEYFGKVPSDRLIAENGTVYFKIDGKLRSKIGLPPQRAKGICGSYDSEQKVLTLLWCSIPSEQKEYVNSKWGEQDNPFEGDMINSYNDGPVEDGSIMGPFYEIETSSPAADLKPGESLNHSQQIVHIQGDEAELAKVVQELFNLDLKKIVTKFQ